MRLEDMLKDISGITNQVVKTNCFEGQNTLLDSILLIQTKVNEVIQAINDGIIKGDKGDTPNVQVGVTETLEPNSNASVTQTGDILNPIFNFGIPKGEKGDKGDTGKASESIQDNVMSLDTTWSSTKIDSLFKNIDDTQGLEYITENNFYSINGSKNGVITDIKLEGKTLVVDSNNNVVIPGTQGAMLKSVGDDVNEIKLNSINKNLFDVDNFKNNVVVTRGNIVYDGDDIILTSTSNDCHTGGVITSGTLPENQRKRCINISDSNEYVLSMNYTTSQTQIYYTWLDKNYKYLQHNFFYVSPTSNKNKLTPPLGSKYLIIRLGIPNANTTIRFSNIMLNIGVNMISYEVNKTNSKKVLYKDTDGTWKKPTLRQWDSIEKHSDGKYYYHKRSGNITYNGTENWSIETKSNIIRGTVILDCFYNVAPICDKLKGEIFNDSDYEYAGIGGSDNIFLGISKTKLSSLDLQGFKSYLQTNNITVVYKLKQDQIFECTPIDLISYDTQTNYSIDCGPIYPKSTLYINSDYGNVLSNIVRRMTQIEEDRIEDRKALIRGDFRLLAEKSYPNDFIKEEELTNE